jgi:hypothetical protein
VQSFAPGPVGQILDNPGTLTPAQPEGITPLGQIKAVELSGGCCGAKRRTKRGGVKTARVKLPRRHEPYFAHDLRGAYGRFQNRLAAGADRFPDRQSGGGGNAAGMDDSFFQSVVVIEAVSQGAIGEHRVCASRFQRRSNQPALRRAPQRSCDLQNHLTEIHGR